MEDSTAEEKGTKNLPPTVITVDTSTKKEDDEASHEGSHDNRPSTNNETETRTPKHANKSLAAATATAQDKKAPNTTANTNETRQGSDSGHPQSQTFFAPRPYEGNMGGPSGAFQPRDNRLSQQHNQLMAMQVSPGSGRYYQNYSQPPAHGQYPSFEQHGPRSHEYGHGPPPPNVQYAHHMYPPQQYPGSFQQRQGPPLPPAWGTSHTVVYHNRPPPPDYRGPPPPPHPGMMHAGYQGGGHAAATSGSTFSRAVSSSFDRSINSKSREGDTKADQRPVMETPNLTMGPPAPAHDDRSISEDGSWRQLNQIQSVDEEEIRRRLAKRGTPTNGQDVDHKPHPASNSSSLTNSPTDGVEAAGNKKEAEEDNLPDPPKMTNSLDSLSSVASTRTPLATKKERTPSKDDTKPPSPADSASLDLMKCPSGTSNLLLPSHQRSLSQFSFEGSGPKRTLEGDTDGSEDTKEQHKARPEEGRPSKRSRTSGEAHEKKSSPLSIACSPSAKDDNKSYPPTSKDSFYDKPPMYSYSIDSAPVMPARGEPTYPSLPPARSHSSDTSTVPPMPPLGDHGHDRDRHPGITQLPSWEIQGQDSFGGASATNPLVGTFSFNQEYPMLSRNNSMLSHPMEAAMHQKNHHGMHMHPSHQHPPPHHHYDRGHALESRNQSFDGGHYHGSFSRAETMSFESRSKGVPDARQGYHQPHYPPHAPSWGSQGSFVPPPPPPMQHYSPPYRMQMQPVVMRSFSQESGQPMPPNFQPPSEFQAPPTNLNKNRPRTEKHIMTTPFVPSKTGVFGWTKEEDMRLTEIVKKFRNPRDWEPVAKELGRKRTAKECHERWIRYLKPGVRKGQWTDQEDAIVMEAVTNSKEQPFTRWSDLAQRLPGRVGKQIRDRWVNHLNPNINHLPFSREDDLLLWEGHKKLGKRWVEIATSFFQSTRSENHIKNRWYSASFKKFIANEFGPNAYHGSKPGRPQKKDTTAKKKSSNIKSPNVDIADDSSTTPVGV